MKHRPSDPKPDEPLDKTPPHAPAPPTGLGSDEETVILGAPLEPDTKGPSQLGGDDETVILSAPISDEDSPGDEAPTVVAPSVGESEAGRMPFATIRADLAKQTGDGTPDEPVRKRDDSSPAKKSYSGLLRQAGVAAAVVVVIAAMWFLFNPQGQREGFKGLTQEERAAIQAAREKKKQEEQAAQQAGEEQVPEDHEQQEEAAELATEQAEAERLAVEQAQAEEAARVAEEQAAEEEQRKLEEAQQAAQEEQRKLEEAQRVAKEEQSKLEEAQRLAEEAQRKSEEEAERLAVEAAARAAEAEAQTEAEKALRLAEEAAQEEALRKAAEDQARVAEEEARLEKEAQQQTESQLKVEALIAGFEVDLAALRLTSPAGNNALSKLQTLLVLDPGNPLINEGFEAIVGKYIGLSKKSSASGQYQKAENYLDKAATVFADSAALETAREELVLLRQAAQANVEAEALAKAEAKAKADEAAKAAAEIAKVEELAKANAEAVTKSGPCSPRLLEPRPNAFADVVSSIYSHPAFLNAPAPKIKWAQYQSSSLINNKATEVSTSRYEIIDADGVSARVQKSHHLTFDNGAGTARFEEKLIGEHIQILGGLISPVDVIKADRETSITDKGITNTTTTRKSTTTTLTRVYDISGQLFPLKVGNSFSYRSDARVVGKDGEVRSVTHKGQPYFYRVSKVVPGKSISGKLECDVYVVDYVFAKPNYHNAGQLYYSEEIGLIERQVGDSVSTLQDGRSISRHYERTLLDFQL